MNLFISAAETSSDLHSAAVVREIRKLVPSAKIWGVGGPALQREGVEIVVSAREMNVMGFTEVVKAIPRLRDRLNTLVDLAKQRRPDALIVVDFPGFHFQLIKKVRRLGIPVFYFIPPKVWVWRSRRTEFLRRWVRQVFCIFPFEVEFFRSRGVNAQYVGNPLVEELAPWMRQTRDDAKKSLGVDPSTGVLVVMPGSRMGEVKRLSSLFAQAAGQFIQTQSKLSDKKWTVWIPLPASAQGTEIEAWVRSAFRDLPVHWAVGETGSRNVLAAADVGLIKSGTSTLEAALLGCPHVVAYDLSGLSRFIFRFWVKYAGPVALSNLILNRQKKTFPEILGADLSQERLAAELSQALRSKSLGNACQEVRKVLSGGLAASKVARECVEQVRALSSQEDKGVAWRLPSFNPVKWAVARVWSLGVTLRMKRHQTRALRIPAKVVSVGNLEMGGVGKTPFTAALARKWTALGKRVVILSRGYGGSWSQRGGVIQPGQQVLTCDAGDEPVLLSLLAPQAWVSVASDRQLAWRQVSHLQWDIVLLDDGFQRFDIEKDSDIVLLSSWDESRVWMREPIHSAQRASLRIWAKGPLAPPVSNLIQPTRMNWKLRVHGTENGRLPKEVGLITTVAKGDEVRAVLESLGTSVHRHWNLSDHSRLSSELARACLDEAKRDGLSLVMTGKDWVKWREVCSEPVVWVENEPEVELTWVGF